MPFHIASIAALPFTMPEPGGNAVASSVESDAMPAKSPLLKKSIHFAFTASMSAFWANAGAISAATKAITGAILRMTHGSRLGVNICAFADFPQDRREDRRLLGASMPGLPSAQRAQRLRLLAKFMKRAGDPRRDSTRRTPNRLVRLGMPYARGRKKFSEFCGHSRWLPARSTPEDPGVLIPLPLGTPNSISTWVFSIEFRDFG